MKVRDVMSSAPVTTESGRHLADAGRLLVRR